MKKSFLIAILWLFYGIQGLAFSTEDIQKLLHERIVFTGPNCFNSAMRLLGIQQVRRHVLNDEMQFILDNYCHPKSGSGINSLGLFRTSHDGLPFHGFVAVSESLAFTKNGASKRSINELQSIRALFGLHSSANQKVTKLHGIKNSHLDMEYYNCERLPLFDIEILMNEIQEKRENAFDERYQQKYLELASRIPLLKDKRECLYFNHILKSLSATWEFIGYAAITSDEVKNLSILKESTLNKNLICD